MRKAQLHRESEEMLVQDIKLEKLRMLQAVPKSSTVWGLNHSSTHSSTMGSAFVSDRSSRMDRVASQSLETFVSITYRLSYE